MDEVVSVQVFCTDLKLHETFNAAYETYFHGHYPARAFLGTDKLLRGGRYQVMGVAIKKNRMKIRFLFALEPAFVLLV